MVERTEAEKLLKSADKIIREYLKQVNSDPQQLQEGLLIQARLLLQQLVVRFDMRNYIPKHSGWTATLWALSRITNKIRLKMHLPLQYYSNMRTDRRWRSVPVPHEYRKEQRRKV